MSAELIAALDSLWEEVAVWSAERERNAFLIGVDAGAYGLVPPTMARGDAERVLGPSD